MRVLSCRLLRSTTYYQRGTSLLRAERLRTTHWDRDVKPAIVWQLDPVQHEPISLNPHTSSRSPVCINSDSPVCIMLHVPTPISWPDVARRTVSISYGPHVIPTRGSKCAVRMLASRYFENIWGCSGRGCSRCDGGAVCARERTERLLWARCWRGQVGDWAVGHGPPQRESGSDWGNRRGRGGRARHQLLGWLRGGQVRGRGRAGALARDRCSRREKSLAPQRAPAASAPSSARSRIGRRPETASSPPSTGGAT